MNYLKDVIIMMQTVKPSCSCFVSGIFRLWAQFAAIFVSKIKGAIEVKEYIVFGSVWIVR